MLTADTNILLHSAVPDSPLHDPACRFFASLDASDEFVLCELILIELYMQLRNPAVFRRPFSEKESADYCLALKSNPSWRCVDYDPRVSTQLWAWAATGSPAFRQIIDARIALTLRHHGITRLATANVKHFDGFGFDEVWNPLLS